MASKLGMERGSRPLALAAGLVAAAIWGGMYVVSRYVLDYVPPLTLVAIRLALAGLFLAALLASRRRLMVRAQDLPILALCGFIGFGISLPAQFAGTRFSTAHDAAVITSASPAFVLVFAALLLRERIGGLRWIAVAVATAGVLVVSGVGSASGTAGGAATTAILGSSVDSVGLGNALLFLAAVTWALYSVVSKAAMARQPALVVTTYAILTGILFVSPTMAAEQTELASIAWDQLPTLVWLGMLYLGLISTAVAFYLWNKAFEVLDAGLASFLLFAQPVVGSVLGWLLLGEHLSGPFYAGSSLIAAGLVLASWQPAWFNRRSRVTLTGRQI